MSFLAWISRGFIIVAIVTCMFAFSGLVSRFFDVILMAARALRPPSTEAAPVTPTFTALERPNVDQASI